MKPPMLVMFNHFCLFKTHPTGADAEWVFEKWLRPTSTSSNIQITVLKTKRSIPFIGD